MKNRWQPVISYDFEDSKTAVSPKIFQFNFKII